MFSRFAPLLVACVALTACAAPALAADVAAPSFSEGIATLLTGPIVYVAYRLFGLQLDAANRASLHSALKTGAGVVISAFEDLVKRGFTVENARNIALEQGLAYVRRAAPDPIKRFKLDGEADHLIQMLTSTETQLRLRVTVPAAVPARAP